VALSLDPQLLEILACPSEDHAPLREVPAEAGRDGELVCTACGRRYPVVDGIPVLLLTEATLAEPTIGTEATLAEPTIRTEAELPAPDAPSPADR